MKNRFDSGMTRHKDDCYETPEDAVWPLLAVFPELTTTAKIYEPCAGPGSITRQLREFNCNVMATELNDYNADPELGIVSGVDFLLEQELFGCDTVVFNPPYKLADQMIRHAFNIGANRVHALLNAHFIYAKGRTYFRERLVMPMLAMGRLKMRPPGAPDKGLQPTVDYVWFTWDRNPQMRMPIVWGGDCRE